MDQPTVTEVLKTYVDFSGIPKGVLDLATERGKVVHARCCALALGVPWFGQGIPEWDGYVESFRRWMGLYSDRVILAETRLYEKVFHYSGKIDLICEMKGVGPVLIDLKTPVAFKKIWLWQIAAYMQLAVANGYQVEKGGTLQLSPDGSPAKMVWADDHVRSFAFFLSALNIQRELEG